MTGFREGVLFQCVNQRVFVRSSNLERTGPLMEAMDGEHFIEAANNLRKMRVRDADPYKRVDAWYLEYFDLYAAHAALWTCSEALLKQALDVPIEYRGNTDGWTWSTCWIQHRDYELLLKPL